MREEKEIFEFLKGELGRQTRERFGDHPKAAVGWQLEMAEERLEAFARVQARERAEGWQIVVAEEEKVKETVRDKHETDSEGEEVKNGSNRQASVLITWTKITFVS